MIDSLLPMWERGWREGMIAILIALLLLIALPAVAQEGTVTDDEVNQVAKQLYCPVCENIPLDVCETPACVQWRAEIRTQLEAGTPPDDIIMSFVNRFGERVVGTPQDPTLRALSLVTPWVLGGLALIIGVQVIVRRRTPTTARPIAAVGTEVTRDDAYYRARLEADLKARR